MCNLKFFSYEKQRINIFLKEEQLLSDAQMNVLHGGGSEHLGSTYS